MTTATLHTPLLILASSSSYRAQTLQKLGLAFQCISPSIDEIAKPNETPKALALRLSLEKAHAVAEREEIKDSNRWIIASDQVASVDGKPLGKPHSHRQATAQLHSQSGKAVHFYTGLCLFNAKTQQSFSAVDTTTAYFKTLSDEQIEGYLLADKPYDCAGSFKSEGLGIALFEKIEATDPNSLVGLPIMLLSEWLTEVNLDPLLNQ